MEVCELMGGQASLFVSVSFGAAARVKLWDTLAKETAGPGEMKLKKRFDFVHTHMIGASCHCPCFC